MAGHREVMNSATENKLPKFLTPARGTPNDTRREAAVITQGTGEGETAG